MADFHYNRNCDNRSDLRGNFRAGLTLQFSVSNLSRALRKGSSGSIVATTIRQRTGTKGLCVLEAQMKIKPNCTFDGCADQQHAKELCKRHYQQQWATGSPEIKRPNEHGTPEERFWRFVQKGETEDSCWSWAGHTDKDGYGTLRVGDTQVRAHRFSYALHFGEPPVDRMIRHRCDNPPCSNPAHLLVGDQIQNMDDRKRAGHYAMGENHPMARLTNDEAREVFEAEGTYAHIAERYGISKSQVGNIKRGRQRRK